MEREDIIDGLNGIDLWVYCGYGKGGKVYGVGLMRFLGLMDFCILQQMDNIY